ncbi:hypothetical protein D9758_015078 [Tetrapyrgos nigripes]|uniref:Uncharacterized protein n=1 Tax=Tetrapyrgos nigripes TaxID=182062 RepID=A0A8H5C863_9AGAR|nr:hypothetical protein D9758_015078 [Tetrapyrgos nigripes]
MTLITRGSSLRPDGFDPTNRKTHKNAETIKLLKSLDLEGKLAMNKEIEEKNRLKRRAKLDKAMGRPADDLSPIASLVTIPDADYEDIRKAPDLFQRVKSLLSTRMLQYMTRKNTEEKAAGKDASGVHAYAPEVKVVRRGSSATTDFNYPNELFLAANHNYLPLGLFHSSRIHRIASTGNNLNTRIVYPNGVKTRIWDIAAMVKAFGFENDDFEGLPTFVEYSDAMKNYSSFVVEWERKKEDGNHAQFIFAHSTFWCKNFDIVDLYPYWKKTEKDLRLDWHDQRLGYDLTTYRYQLQNCRTAYTLDQRLSLQRRL